MYSWHGSYYLGGMASTAVRQRSLQPACISASTAVHACDWFPGAHGLCGILHTLLLACDFWDPAQLLPGGDLLALTERATLALVAATFPSGNLPSSLGKETDKCSPNTLRACTHCRHPQIPA